MKTPPRWSVPGDIHNRELQESGKIRAFGISNYTAVRLMRAHALAAKEHLPPYATLQAKYNLLRRGIELEHVPL